MHAKKNRKAIHKEEQRQFNEMVDKIEKRDKAKEKKYKEAQALMEYNRILKQEKDAKQRKEFQAKIRKEEFNKKMQ